MTDVGSKKLVPKFIGPFRLLRHLVNEYTIGLPRKMRTYPIFHVGRLKPYYKYGASSGKESPCAQASPTYTCARGAASQPASEVRLSPRDIKRYPDYPPPACRKENFVPARSQAAK